ncbi:TonB-dependent receptor plug domain-containing protein [candidate division KSB1 bacterium]|nr:TonB-dependent receptor plug domain-containing protein [candidate division KSB1 bacterium]
MLQSLPVVSAPDIFQALQKLPGISTANEANPQISLRGGSFDQTLVLLDGAVMYYPFHYLGMVSSLPDVIVDQVFVSPGAFSTRYGNRLSGVLQVYTKNPANTWNANINLNLLGAEFSGSFKPLPKLYWMAAARTNFKQSYNLFFNEDFQFAFYDIWNKLIYKFSDSIKFSAFVFLNNDRQIFDNKHDEWLQSDRDDARLKYRSVAGANFDVTHRAEFPDNIDSKFLSYKSQIETDLAQSNSQSGTRVDNRFIDNTVKTDLEWKISSSSQLNSGLQLSSFSTDYYWLNKFDFSPYVNIFFDYAPGDRFDFRRHFSTIQCYLENLWTASRFMEIRTGIRLSRWSYSSTLQEEPRLNIVLKAGANTRLKFGAGRFTQGIATALERGLVTFLPLYFPVDQHNTVESADHLMASFEQTVGDVAFAVTAYRKYFHHLLRSELSDSSIIFVDGPGQADGIECEINYNNHALSGWLNYTYAHSHRTYTGAMYDASFDRRHQIKCFGSYALSERWNFSAYWEFSTGQPYDPGKYNLITRGGNYYPNDNFVRHNFYHYYYDSETPVGMVRYPCYHRLDMNVRWLVRKTPYRLSTYLSVRNAYARKNVLYYTDVRVDGYDDYGNLIQPVIRRTSYSLPVIPTAGLVVEF